MQAPIQYVYEFTNLVPQPRRVFSPYSNLGDWESSDQVNLRQGQGCGSALSLSLELPATWRKWDWHMKENFCPLQGSLGFSGLKLEKVWKWVPGASRPRGPKSRKRSRKRVKIVKKQSILTLFRLGFRVFDFLGPGNSFSDYLSNFRPEGPKWPL